MRYISIPIFIGILLLISGGCGSDPRQADARTRAIPAPPAPPAVPEARAVAVDPNLLQAARQQIDRSLQSTAVEPRVHALEAVQNLGIHQEKQQVINALKAPEPVVRFAAALTAGGLRLTEAHQALLESADDSDYSVRAAVRYALHRLGDYRLSHDLEALARDPRVGVRANTALVLGLLGEPSGIRILNRLRKDPEPTVRQQASEAMWRLGNESGLADLVGMSVSRYPDDQMIAFTALAEPRDQRVRAHIRAGLTAEWIEVNLVAARAMGMLGSDEGYTIAMKGAESKDPRQRFMAAVALGAIGRADAQDQLKKLLADDYESVRVAAAQGVLQLK